MRSCVISVGIGSAAAFPLDWEEPIKSQKSGLATNMNEADLLIAADTVWLGDLVRPFVQTALALVITILVRIVCNAFLDDR